MKLSLAPYAKTVASFIGTTLLWAAVAYVPDGSIDRTEWYALALKLAVDLGVFGVTNGQRKTVEPVRQSPLTPSFTMSAPGSNYSYITPGFAPVPPADAPAVEPTPTVDPALIVPPPAA